MGRPSGKSLHIDKIRELYCSEEWSLSEISQELGISVQTLSRWLGEEGIELQPRHRNPNAGRTAEEQAEINARVSELRMGKGTGARKISQSAACEQCGDEFVLTTPTQRFCTRSCARTADGIAVSTQNGAQWLASDASLCPCGQSRISYAVRHTTKYCSPECRELYGLKKGKARDEANYVTFSCQHCGQEVVRPRSYVGAFKYCSNACAVRHTKVKKHIAVGDAVVLDSGYEAAFYGICCVHKVRCDRYDREYGADWGESGYYAPDFAVWIDGKSIPFELKGMEGEEDVLKWAAFREQRGPLVVLDGEALKKLFTPDSGNFLRALRSLAAAS